MHIVSQYWFAYVTASCNVKPFAHKVKQFLCPRTANRVLCGPRLRNCCWRSQQSLCLRLLCGPPLRNTSCRNMWIAYVTPSCSVKAFAHKVIPCLCPRSAIPLLSCGPPLRNTFALLPDAAPCASLWLYLSNISNVCASRMDCVSVCPPPPTTNIIRIGIPSDQFRTELCRKLNHQYYTCQWNASQESSLIMKLNPIMEFRSNLVLTEAWLYFVYNDLISILGFDYDMFMFLMIWFGNDSKCRNASKDKCT